MKKRGITRFCAALTAFTIAVCSVPLTGSGSDYNDKTYQSYGNLAENSDIPSLFRNDEVFSGYKDYPPVICDGVEYVPLELFYGLSNVKINYSEDESNFYIQNKKTNEYISFSVNDNYAVTGNNKVYQTNVHTFYGVHYVPLGTVCSNVGIGYSTYNDDANKVYAIEVYTNEKGLSAQDLVGIHTPQLYPGSTSGTTDGSTLTGSIANGGFSGIGTALPETPGYTLGYSENISDTYNQNQSDGITGEKNQGSENQDGSKNNQTQKPSEYRNGTVMLFYPSTGFSNAPSTLKALSSEKLRATFFVTESDILTYPDIIRSIYTSGHTIGITFDPEDSQLYKEGVLEERVKSAESALYEVAKIKTRIVYLPKDEEGICDSEQVSSTIESLGLCRVNLNADSKTDTFSSKKAESYLRESLLDVKKNFGSETAYMKMSHTASGNYALGVIADIAKSTSKVKIRLFDETYPR